MNSRTGANGTRRANTKCITDRPRYYSVCLITNEYTYIFTGNIQRRNFFETTVILMLRFGFFFTYNCRLPAPLVD